MAEYITQDGQSIDEATVDRWAAEADAAYQDGDFTVTPFTGRPWEVTTAPTRPRTIRVSDSLRALV